MTEPGLWTVRTDTGEVKSVRLCELLDEMQAGRIGRFTLISPPAAPSRFRPAGDWPLFWAKFGTAPARTRGHEDLRVCQCGEERGLWFDELEQLYSANEDERLFEVWLDRRCTACGSSPREEIDHERS